MRTSTQRAALILIAAFACLIPFAFAPATSAQVVEAGAATTCDSTLILLVLLAERDYGYQSSLDVATFEKGQYSPYYDAMMGMGEGDIATTPEAASESMDMATPTATIECAGMTTPEATTESADMTTPESTLVTPVATAEGMDMMTPEATVDSTELVTTEPTAEGTIAPTPAIVTMEATTEGTDMSTPEATVDGAELATPEASMDGEILTRLAPGNVPGEDPTCTELRADVETYLFVHLALMDVGM
ncbi:MAG: hypothetical protein IT320_07815 [Anaerolineae bacterium]|nr:hypothetical protein [Anaerolineae bacterium]